LISWRALKPFELLLTAQISKEDDTDFEILSMYLKPASSVTLCIIRDFDAFSEIFP
jgi:hypothetical protein